MIKKLSIVGNSKALLLDRPILEMIGLEENGRVQLTVRDGSLIVTPVRPRLVDQKRLKSTLKRAHSKRRRLLRSLSE